MMYHHHHCFAKHLKSSTANQNLILDDKRKRRRTCCTHKHQTIAKNNTKMRSSPWTTTSLLLVSAFTAGVNAFTTPMSSTRALTTTTTSSRVVDLRMMIDKPEMEEEGSTEILPTTFSSFPSVPALTVAFWALASTPAFADSPDWGLFEGRIGSLLHPVTMGSLLAWSISTALLGFQWRRQRTIGDEITNLKKTMPDMGGASSLSEALKIAQSAEVKDAWMITRLQNAASTDAQIKEMQLERKELAEQAPRDKHFNQGALLAFVGTVMAIEGPLNTYARTGKLFPGPHLYAGAGLVCLWALAASCVPAMQKGNDTARSIHIGANAAGVGLFGWQVVSGWPILLKVLEKTSWP